MKKAFLLPIFLFHSILSMGAEKAADFTYRSLVNDLSMYRKTLASLQKEYGGTRKMPDVRFFLFGMGPRRKCIYTDGKLLDAFTGNWIEQWNVASEMIVPSEYTVWIKTKNGEPVRIAEDEQALFIERGGSRRALSRGAVRLPRFDGHPYAPVLRVLHQEILVNMVNGKPLPNFFVYRRPWYRDAAMMAMVLQKTGNLELIRNWVLGLLSPFDRNNRGESEADNLGQALYLVSLVSDQSHPLVRMVLDSIPRFRSGNHIRGRTDFSEHPAYQTKWLKFGLASLGLEDTYGIPAAADSYSSLFWWAYRDQHVPGSFFDTKDYPYLVWAEDHFYGKKNGLIADRDYPLTWEAKASQADYNGMRLVSEEYVKRRLCAPHTWHAAEVFLRLFEQD